MALASVLRRTGSTVLATAIAAFCAATAADSGHAQVQSQPVTTAGTPSAKPAQPAVKPQVKPQGTAHSVHGKHHLAAKVEPPPVVEPPHPAAPPPPDWPVNDKAQPAVVDWNGRNLSISATNSSLQQILKDVSTATGVEVEGAASDQRIYGSYGPAPARDVLGKLLEGSGYNILMIGDKGEGTPRTLVLSAKSSLPASQNAGAKSHPTPSPDEDEAPEAPEPPEQPEQGNHRPVPMPGGEPGQSRTPQQIMQDIQQRQQNQQGQPNTNTQSPNE